MCEPRSHPGRTRSAGTGMRGGRPRAGTCGGRVAAHDKGSVSDTRREELVRSPLEEKPGWAGWRRPRPRRLATPPSQAPDTAPTPRRIPGGFLKAGAVAYRGLAPHSHLPVPRDTPASWGQASGEVSPRHARGSCHRPCRELPTDSVGTVRPSSEQSPLVTAATRSACFPAA